MAESHLDLEIRKGDLRTAWTKKQLSIAVEKQPQWCMLALNMKGIKIFRRENSQTTKTSKSALESSYRTLQCSIDDGLRTLIISQPAMFQTGKEKTAEWKAGRFTGLDQFRKMRPGKLPEAFCAD